MRSLDLLVQFPYNISFHLHVAIFHIVRMPDASGNIPEHIFYGSISSELLRIARASLKYSDFLEKGR